MPAALTVHRPLSADDKYPVTTNYYWANIDVNMTSTQGDDTWTTGQGPAGFENSLILQQGVSREDGGSRLRLWGEWGIRYELMI